MKFTLLFPLFYVNKDTNRRNVVSPIFHLHYKFNQAVWKQFWHFELSYLDIYNTHFLHLMPNSKTFSLPQLLALVYNSSSFLPQTFKHFILICNYLCCRDILYYGYLFKRIYSNSNFHCRKTKFKSVFYLEILFYCQNTLICFITLAIRHYLSFMHTLYCTYLHLQKGKYHLKSERSQITTETVSYVLVRTI